MIKELYFADTLESVKYNKTLKTLPLHLYESMQLSSQVVYFIQTGGSALSNTNSFHACICFLLTNHSNKFY